jgi:hypothetical protein
MYALMLHIPIKFSNCLYGIQQGKKYGFGGVFLWFRNMKDEISEHSITFCWVCSAGKIPASNIRYRILWVQEDERRARIVNPAENKLWMQQGLNL